jgi:hypothetical protein
MVRKIVSGGQTGVDRAGLDVALELEIPCGGWCPKGRKSEDGCVPEKYPLTETNAEAYSVRTELNVKDSDGTLLLTWGAPTGGTLLTLKVAGKLKKPHLVVDLRELDGSDNERVLAWIRDEKIGVLNIAGPRESEALGVHDTAVGFLRETLLSVEGIGVRQGQ